MMRNAMSNLWNFPQAVAAACRRMADRWRDDTYGTSMITTAVTLPLLVIFLIGIFHLFRVLTIKWEYDKGLTQAAQYISEEAGFWEYYLEADGQIHDVDGNPLVDQYGTAIGIPPADFYDIEAKRIILSRLRDVFNEKQVYDVLTTTLHVTVTEPPISWFVRNGYVTLSSSDMVTGTQTAVMDQLCDRPNKYDERLFNAKEYRNHNNIRFRIYATMDLPVIWTPMLPFTDDYTVTMQFKSRAVGYVQCPRFSGQRESGSGDKTRVIGVSGPALRFRELQTPGFPTVTPLPPTITPTMAATPLPSATP